MLHKIGVLTSGGDAPGMNCAIRAVVRAGLRFGLEVYGINDGYRGLVEDDMVKMDRSSVSRIVNRGGTILRTARLREFKEESVRQKAVDNLRRRGIEALVVIGGDGSYMGAKKLTDQQLFEIKSHSYGSIGCTVEWLWGELAATPEQLAAWECKRMPAFMLDALNAAARGWR